MTCKGTGKKVEVNNVGVGICPVCGRVTACNKNDQLYQHDGEVIMIAPDLRSFNTQVPLVFYY